jgi:hypothetical protein
MHDIHSLSSSQLCSVRIGIHCFVRDYSVRIAFSSADGGLAFATFAFAIYLLHSVALACERGVSL